MRNFSIKFLKSNRKKTKWGGASFLKLAILWYNLSNFFYKWGHFMEYPLLSLAALSLGLVIGFIIRNRFKK